ncbi:MAG: error-prone DNA polymerase [Alphaproteobacteria bacterium]|nr:error-prone DNA polymerase [Alphaproteobacteria bacterium]MBU1560735.1 error-prone DNA polymerase [Alphaproteobacteria bacterium]MBU2302944.1 error-prone DNA polymerase [Alphaproteobacteria bacterium]MBU2367671.1 error-prone DNA polymerase [Alphaproteobacteria bacterium]
MAAYAELVAATNFSFLRGASHPYEMVAQAAALGLSGIGICDRNSMSGVVRAFAAARDLKTDFPDFRLVVGTRLVFSDGTPDIVVYPTDREAYGRLCALLTLGNRRAPKGECHLALPDLLASVEGLLFIVMLDHDAFETGMMAVQAMKSAAPGQVWVGATYTYDGTDRARLNKLAAACSSVDVPMLATMDALYHEHRRRILQDVLTCIREGTTIEEAGYLLAPNGERFIRSPSEMTRLFREHPDALAQSQLILGRIGFTLDELKYIYPEETVGNGETAQQTLERLAYEGAGWRYPNGIPEKVMKGLEHELALIAEMNYAAYFLTVQDIVRFARQERGILCQGRGSAANSAVCFCLGITEVDPMLVDLLFERFVSTERDEPPDIDVDFEHERREEVMQYIYQKYGRHRAGLTANVITYRSKGALRDVGKVFGLDNDTIGALSGLNWGWGANDLQPERVRSIGLDPDQPVMAMVLEVAKVLYGFPRHLGQHVGGFVITRDRLDHLLPISNAAMEDRTVIEWNKDDLDELGILKVDVLALGMLSCIRRSFNLLRQHYGLDLTLATVPQEDERTYKMTHRADTIGVFQIESRAQMSMLPRLKPSEFYDLVIEVAIVRPGPIQGDMVHPYLKRRQGLEPTTFPSPELEHVLKKTYGVPLFQEQAMKIAIVAGGFTPGEADRLRRAMATFKRTGGVGIFRDKFINGMLERGYEKDFAERCFQQIEGFGSYGFPESHAASFALLVYVSCWIKCHYPDVFAAALLNSQPMGFYAPAQIVRDAQEHGVDVRPVDINLSDLEIVMEHSNVTGAYLAPRHAEMRDDIWGNMGVRLGFNMIKGLRTEHANLIIARRRGGYDSIRDLWLRTGLSPAVLESLAEADAFQSLGLSRRDALWVAKGLIGTHGAEVLPLFKAGGEPMSHAEEESGLPAMPPGEEVIHDYRTLSISLKAHPMSFLRDEMTTRGIVTADALRTLPAGRTVIVAGLVLVRQRPGTASGVIFATLEDETGVANVIVWPKTFEANRRTVLGARVMGVRGQLQREGIVTHVIAKEFIDLTPQMMAIAGGHDMGEAVVARADEGKSGPHGSRTRERDQYREMMDRRALAALPSGRNFH